MCEDLQQCWNMDKSFYLFEYHCNKNIYFQSFVSQKMFTRPSSNENFLVVRSEIQNGHLHFLNDYPAYLDVPTT